MRSFVVLAFLGVAVGLPLFSQELYGVEFDRFMNDFNVSYASHELAERFEIFKANFDYIENFNRKAMSDIRLGITPFAAMTAEEFTNMNGCASVDPDAEDDFVATTDDVAVEVPSSIDWVSKGAVTPVKNQGYCGSCWSFSATGAMEGAIFVKDGVLNSLSEQDLVDCSGKVGNQGCNGGWPSKAFLFSETYGLAAESAYKYTAKDGQCHSYTPSAHSKATGYKFVAKRNQDALQAAIAQQPVSVLVEADQALWQHYKSGTVTTKDGCGTRIDHAVLAVGYGTDENGVDYFKVKNSWGPKWGNGGYIRIQRTKNSFWGSAGVCGIATQPSFPVVA